VRLLRCLPSGANRVCELTRRIKMLVLSRKPGETIMIGDIVVTIVRVRGDQVQVGIDAPKTVPVHRGEIYAAIREEWKRDGH